MATPWFATGEVRGECGHPSNSMGNFHPLGSKLSSQATIWRRREAYQMNFTARMQWTMTPEFALANHAPILVVNNDSTLRPLLVKTDFRSTVFLDASGSWDPDAGNTLEFRWTQYSEPPCTRWTVRWTVPSLRIEDVSSGFPKMAKVATCSETSLRGRTVSCLRWMLANLVVGAQ